MEVKFIALSGTVGVTENLYVYEYGDEMVIVDVGVGFPEMEMQGVDLVIPDFSYIRNNSHKLKAIFLSQGHEDHQGALPFLLRDVKAPIYAPKLVAAFVRDKLDEAKIKGIDIKVFDPDKDVINVGVFTFTPFRVNHSIPDTVGYAIDTPQGRIFHVAEHKFDPNPVDGFPFDEEKARRLASEKEVVFLASDCLGANKPGRTPTEQEIETEIEKIVKGAPKAIYFTTISSNIGRMQQVLRVAKRQGRKVCFVGRSIQSKAEIAYNLGYLHYEDGMVVNLHEAKKMSNSKLLYVIAGCYGQVGSALYRVAVDEHKDLAIEENDMIVFSADPAPPYTKESVNFVVDQLVDKNAEVHYYDMEEDIYVSGHGKQEDIKRLWEIVKPKYLIPVGGTIRFMRAYRNLAEKNGFKKEQVFELRPGDSVNIVDGVARKGDRVKVRDVLVDGLGIGDVGRVILEDRKVLGEHGTAVVILQISKDKSGLVASPDIISRGFVFQKEEQDFLRNSSKLLANKIKERKAYDRNKAKLVAMEVLADHFLVETGRKPLIIPVVVEV